MVDDDKDGGGYDFDEIPELALLSAKAWASLVAAGHPEESRHAEAYDIEVLHLEEPWHVIHQVFSALLAGKRENVFEGRTMLAHVCGEWAAAHVKALYLAYEAEPGESPTTPEQRRDARLRAGCPSASDLS